MLFEKNWKKLLNQKTSSVKKDFNIILKTKFEFFLSFFCKHWSCLLKSIVVNTTEHHFYAFFMLCSFAAKSKMNRYLYFMLLSKLLADFSCLWLAG